MVSTIVYTSFVKFCVCSCVGRELGFCVNCVILFWMVKCVMLLLFVVIFVVVMLV